MKAMQRITVALNGALDLGTYRKLLGQLDKLPPKKLIIWSNKPSEVVGFGADEEQDLGARLTGNMERIGTSEFTGKADLQTVPNLYKGYVEELVVLLSKSFAAYQQSQEEGVRSQLPPPPSPAGLYVPCVYDGAHMYISRLGASNARAHLPPMTSYITNNFFC